MMGILVRSLLALAGTAAGLLVARDAPNLGVVQGMLALAIAGAGLIALALIMRR